MILMAPRAQTNPFLARVMSVLSPSWESPDSVSIPAFLLKSNSYAGGDGAGEVAGGVEGGAGSTLAK